MLFWLHEVQKVAEPLQVKQFESHRLHTKVAMFANFPEGQTSKHLFKELSK